MATKKNTIIAILALAAAVAAAVVVCIVMMRGRSAAPEDPYNEPYARMTDPAYLEQLKVQRDEQKEIMVRMNATRREIAALGDDTNSVKYAELKARLESEAEELSKNHLKAQAIVRERINRENAAIKAKKESLKQKGN